MFGWLFGKSIWGRIQELEERVEKMEEWKELFIKDSFETQDVLESLSVDVFNIKKAIKKNSVGRPKKK